MAENRFVILGIHDEGVTTVNEYDENGVLVKEINVARVRMFVGDRQIDEDFPLPNLKPVFPRTQEIFEAFLEDDINARMKVLEGEPNV